MGENLKETQKIAPTNEGGRSHEGRKKNCMLLGPTTIWVPPLLSTSLFGFSPLKTVSVVERFECMLLGPTTIWVPPLESTSLFGFSPLKTVFVVERFECMLLGPTTRGKMLSRQFPSRPYVWLRLVSCVDYGQIWIFQRGLWLFCIGFGRIWSLQVRFGGRSGGLMAMFGRSVGMSYQPMYKLPLIHLSVKRLVYSIHGQNRGEQVFGFDTRVRRTQQKGCVGRFEALGCGQFGEMSPMFLPERRDVENVGV